MSEFFIHLQALLLSDKGRALAVIHQGINEGRVSTIPAALSEIDRELAARWIEWRDSVAPKEWDATVAHVFKKGHHYLRRW